MKVILAQSAGFCFGVKRATSMAFAAAEEYQQICSLGPIIHSPQLVKKLEEKGVEVISSVDAIPDGAVIVRSHGITAGELDEITERQLKIIDATCPFVKKAQDYAAQLGRDGYAVVLVGEKEHPEVQGIISFVGEGECWVVADRHQAENLPRRGRIGVVAQTTQSFENLRQVVEVCLGKSKELRVFNTICSATSVRQDEASAIAREVDMMLVIGGFNSANTTRLAQICRDLQPNTHHVETAEQIEEQWFSDIDSVGVTAGASTPQWIIDEVLNRVAMLGK